MEKDFWLSMYDDVEIYVKKWFNPNQKPKAIVQLAHGMAEHINRYHPFSNYLVENNIAVFGNDHRGHGQTGEKQGSLGYFADENGFEKVTNDLFEVTLEIKKEYPDTPVYLVGHSMGSFLSRAYIQKYSQEVDGVILSGTGYFPKFQSLAGKQVAAVLPPKEETKLMNALTFGSYNKKVDDMHTTFDWLTRDQKMVQSYIDDPYCGFVPKARFFYDLMDGIKTIQDKRRNEAVRKDLPMLLVSGDADPVGDYAKGVWKTAQLYEKAGLENIASMFFHDGRHEILNELNKEEVFNLLFHWLRDQMNQSSK
ncbi:lysophospholipase [Virgibacillus phasianinus]|uniref:Lysophospholipase n=1 Tax=Virgibacillus phasianinus TaxID=2017483 RepID=A0A220U4W4_9BACI|nr:alpha/beta hydrolase [Virgibacillus phasianinus]ASK62763.1 lysophospholipase [Virgibacillus phasianinus]